MTTWRVLFRVNINYSLSTAASLLKILSFAPLLPPCSEKLNLTSWIQFNKKLKNKLENKQKIKKYIYYRTKIINVSFKKSKNFVGSSGRTRFHGCMRKMMQAHGNLMQHIICLSCEIFSIFDLKYSIWVKNLMFSFAFL